MSKRERWLTFFSSACIDKVDVNDKIGHSSDKDTQSSMVTRRVCRDAGMQRMLHSSLQEAGAKKSTPRLRQVNMQVSHLSITLENSS